MNDENLQEVYYDRYCKTCEHKKLPEEADPCDECLSNPVNYATHILKFRRFKEDKKKQC